MRVAVGEREFVVEEHIVGDEPFFSRFVFFERDGELVPFTERLAAQKRPFLEPSVKGDHKTDLRGDRRGRVIDMNLEIAEIDNVEAGLPHPRNGNAPNLVGTGCDKRFDAIKIVIADCGRDLPERGTNRFGIRHDKMFERQTADQDDRRRNERDQ